MTERPHSRYTRAKTWAALHRQHINAGYALVPYSATNNSIAVVKCEDAAHTQAMMKEFVKYANECAAFYASHQTPDKAPAILSKARQVIVLAKSSDYHTYHLMDHVGFSLVACGLHDSYLHLPVWEMRSNTRYAARETAVKIGSPEFETIRCTHYGHSILIGALVNGDQAALSYVKTLPKRTQRRLIAEAQEIQDKHYRGRPLAFLTDAERRAVGSKISAGLHRYHEKRKRSNA